MPPTGLLPKNTMRACFRDSLFGQVAASRGSSRHLSLTRTTRVEALNVSLNALDPHTLDASDGLFAGSPSAHGAGDCDPSTWKGCPTDELYTRDPEVVRRLKAFQALRMSPTQLHQDLGALREASTQNSGAYIFRPQQPDMQPVAVGAGRRGAAEAVEVLLGTEVIEVRQRFASWLNQTIRLYKGQVGARVGRQEAEGRGLEAERALAAGRQAGRVDASKGCV